MFAQALANGIFQVILFTLIPFIWWVVSARKKENFFFWLGIKKPNIENKKRWILFMLFSFIILLGLGELAIYLRGPLAATESQYKGMGITAIPSVVAYSFIQTGLSEEILFRGFLLKRLATKFNFLKGNLIQATIFGIVHILMVWGQTSFLAGLMIVIYPMLTAIWLAYINEKMSDGSILPSWLIHGSLNTISILMTI